MAPRNRFRFIVAISVALTVVTGILDYTWHPSSPEWAAVLEWDGNGGVLQYLKHNLPATVVGRVVLFLSLLALLIYMIAVQIGLFLFWSFARIGYVLLVAFFTVVATLDGLAVAAPWEVALGTLSCVLDGAIICLSYVAPISRHFEGRDV
jgi:hypothetical protein